MKRRSPAFYWLAAFFGLFVSFLYGPMIVIFILSFQGLYRRPDFPDERSVAALVRAAVEWRRHRQYPRRVHPFARARLRRDDPHRSPFAERRAGLPQAVPWREAPFFVAVASLIVPSIVTSLGIALEFRLLDDFLKNHGPGWIADNVKTTMGVFTSGLGAHLTWTLPFGLLVMFAIFNRFDNRYEEAARDLGATPWQTLRSVILPIILPSVIGVGFFGFTLSWDEIARSSQAMGEHNTLPMELQALTTTVTTPEIYALGTATTGVSFAVIALALLGIVTIRARQARHGSDAGQA